MINKKIIFALSIVCLFCGLNACSSKDRNYSNQANIAVGDTSENNLDWDGTYFGVIPCADCAGIETKISLNLDNTYQIS